MPLHDMEVDDEGDDDGEYEYSCPHGFFEDEHCAVCDVDADADDDDEPEGSDDDTDEPK